MGIQAHGAEILLFLIAFFFFVVFIVFGFISVREKETRAAGIFFISGIFFLGLFCLILLFGPASWKVFFLITPWVALLILFAPLGRFQSGEKIVPQNRIDERDVMFSRRLLQKKTGRYDTYYSRFPERKKTDDKIRSKPGLLSEKATLYNPLSFAAANASFQTVEQLSPSVDGQPEPVQIELDPSETTDFIKHWLKKLGAADVGITLLQDYHLYSFLGRDHNYGNEVRNHHRFAIAFTVEMDREMIDRAPQGPTVMESARKYLDAGAIAVQLGYFIRNLGYEARAHIDAHYEVVCPLVARDAGLGTIGRMGLLMTPRFGPRVRIGVVTTSMSLKTDKRKEDQTMVDFCERCKKCAISCPGQAISFESRKVISGVKRWQINQEKCYDYWCQTGTDCGRCISVCPYSHPDNLLHRIVRYGIRNNVLFRRLAVPLDDLFYGKKPQPKPLQKWMGAKSWKSYPEK